MLPTMPGWVTIFASAAVAACIELEHANLPAWAMVIVTTLIPILTYIAHLTTSPRLPK